MTAPASDLSKPDANERPVRLFRLPYANEFYPCTCDAPAQSACTCSQETILSPQPNPHLSDPEVVAWLERQEAPFTLEEAAQALGIALTGKNPDVQIITRVRLRRELSSCNCAYDAAARRFTSPGVETLRRLLRFS